jgi:hypothetical protein
MALNGPAATGRLYLPSPTPEVMRTLLSLLFLLGACDDAPTVASASDEAIGCDGQTYPDPSDSPYVLPFAVGETYRTGLTNCSESFHGPGQPDQYAFDFDMPVGTPFVAARAGTVTAIDEDEPSEGGGAGNYVLIDHGDGTFAYYLHSPTEGIDVEVGDEVAQGQRLGVTGRSGLAGYSHLHFIVVEGSPAYPYDGVAVSFRNAQPAHPALEGNTRYEAVAY